MNAGGDAAEQVVRMSLEGVEVAARISGEGAKQLAILIAAVLKEEQKTKRQRGTECFTAFFARRETRIPMRR